MATIPTISISELLDSGVHFGHKVTRWNPKMAPYIYGARDDIHIMDLRQTAVLLPIALQAIFDTAKRNGKILFVSTKVQASEIVAEYAEKCGQYYVNYRWLGGMLTNWQTISASIKTLEDLEKILDNEEISDTYTKKELLEISRRKDKLLKSLGGIRAIGGKPDLMVVIDTNKERLAVGEAVKLGIPIVAILDSNCDPDNIEYPVPGNDDAIRSIKLYCKLFSDAALAGIKESLAESGVDLGAVENLDGSSFGHKSEIKKLKNTNKVAKSTPRAQEQAQETEQAFEEELVTIKDTKEE
jgi:small subunit ribosomal protein S2